MTLPQNVKDAFNQAFAWTGGEPTFRHLETIRAHLMSQEVEIYNLRADRDSWLDQASQRVEDWDDMRRRAESAESRLAAANAQLRLMHRVLSQAVCVACADDGSAKDHELDKLEGVLRDQGWITSAVVPSTPTDEHLQGAGDEA